MFRSVELQHMWTYGSRVRSNHATNQTKSIQLQGGIKKMRPLFFTHLEARGPSMKKQQRLKGKALVSSCDSDFRDVP